MSFIEDKKEKGRKGNNGPMPKKGIKPPENNTVIDHLTEKDTDTRY